MRIRRIAQAFLSISLVVLPIPPALAHAELVSSTPAVGAHLTALPRQVTVNFDGNLLTIGGSKTNILMVKDPSGVEIDAKNSKVTGASLTVDVNPTIETGLFHVSWRVVSADGHPEQGSYTFTVSTSSSAPSSAPIAQVAHTDSFWKVHSTQVLLVLLGSVAIAIWIGFEIARRRKE